MRWLLALCLLIGCKGTVHNKFTVAMMPKCKGNPFFITVRQGAEAAAKELDVELLWDGPTATDPAKQAEIVEGWITRGVNVIAADVENKAGLAAVLRKARAKGIQVITWDADTEPDARAFFVNQATAQGIGNALVDRAAQILGGDGEFAIITASLTAANQNEWIKHIKARLAQYPKVRLVADPFPSDDKQEVAFAKAQEILKVYPNVKLIMSICSPAVPAAAEAVKQADRKDVKVIGLGLPNDNKRYVHEGIVDCVILWNTHNLGYLTVYAAHAAAKGTLKPGSMTAGKLGTIEVKQDEVLLGPPFTFDKENIDGFDF
jgi:rhamnose transport system permease protein